LAVMAIGMPYLGFAVTGTLTMIILLRTVEQTHWFGSVVLAVTSSASVVWLFGHVLGMVLPRGPWGW
jgi:putative tricarboxylic transport membrane protein